MYFVVLGGADVSRILPLRMSVFALDLSMRKSLIVEGEFSINSCEESAFGGRF